MPDDLARRSHAVLKRAIEIEGPQRHEFIESACAGDAALLRKVRTLVAALDDSQGFLETPALGDRSAANAATTSAHDHAPPGTDIGGYRILRVIGSGGMATVYEAMQDQPRRRVALKVMKRGLERTGALHRFRFETEVLARLRHPGIAQIFEAGASSAAHGAGVPFFAMEHVEGARTITAYAAEHDLDLHQRLEMFAAVCDAVQHGHQSGVIHRDLKPSNILVDASGHPKVIDFGVARAADPGQAWITQQTDLGQLIGTLNSMSPEQCAGDAEVDIRADVYSLGVVLYELVCGRLPHDLGRVPVPEALRIVREDTPARPSAHNPACRGDVDAIVMRAIDKEPERRYPTAAALASDIRRSLNNQTIEARPPSVLDQWRRFTRRNRTLVGAVAALALAIVAGGVLSAAFGYRAVQESRRRLAAEHQALQERDAALWQGYIANIAAAIAAFNFGELHQTRVRLAAAAPQHRGWEWRFINGLAERTLETVEAHDGLITHIDASPDGARLATASADGSIRIWDTSTLRDPIHISAGDGEVASVSFSPDGSMLLSGGDDRTARIWDAATGGELRALGEHAERIASVSWGRAAAGAGGARQLAAVAYHRGPATLWDVQSGELVRTLDDQPGDIQGVLFSRDGGRLLTWGRAGSVWVRTADGAEVLHRVQMPANIFCAATSDDGAIAAAGSNDAHIVLWDLRTGAELRRLRHPSHVTSIRSLAFSPSGEMLVSGHGDRTIVLWSVATGEQHLPMLRAHEEAVTGLRVTPDGSRLISAAWDRTIRTWSLEGDRPAELIATLRGHEGRLDEVCFSPDGALLASAAFDGTVRLWDPELGREIGVLHVPGGQVFALGFAPDGRTLATGSGSGQVRLWSTAAGDEEATLQAHTTAVQALAFSPDGRTLASAGTDRLVKIWDVASRRLVHELAGHTSSVHCLAFSPDGRTLVSGSNDQTARLWDPLRGQPLRVLGAHNSDVMAAVFSADGTTLYTGSRDQTVRAWCTATFEHTVLGGHGQLVTSLSLSPDGSRLAAGSWFGEVVLWDLATRDIVLSFKAHDTVARSVAFDPTGRWLATASFDRTIRLYDSLPQPDRRRRRAELARSAEAAASAVDEILRAASTPADAAAALRARGDLPAETLAAARRLILMHGLRAEPPGDRERGGSTAAPSRP